MKIIPITSAILLSYASVVAQEAQESSFQASGKIGTESRLFLTELPPQGFHNKAIAEASTTFKLGDKITLNAGARSQFALSDTEPVGTKNEGRFFINRLGLNYEPLKDLEIILGTFQEPFFGWSEQTLPRNGAHIKKTFSTKNAKLILEGQYHLGQPIQPMIKDAQTPYYGFSTRIIQPLGNSRLIAGLNFKDFKNQDAQESYLVINALARYITQINNGSFSLTALGMANTGKNEYGIVYEDNKGLVISAELTLKENTFTLRGLDIGQMAAPREFAPHYSPKSGFRGGGAEITRRSGDYQFNVAAIYGAVRDGRDATQFRATVTRNL